MKNQKKKNQEITESKIAGTRSKSEKINPRGRIFEGRVLKKFDQRVSITFERMVYVKKYERYKKMITKLHARLPRDMDENIQVGDLIQIRECRPLSKIIHFVVTNKIKGANEK